jgi:signal transduction histidine kinase
MAAGFSSIPAVLGSIIRSIPEALGLPLAGQLRSLREVVKAESCARQAIERELRTAYSSMEARIDARTAVLTRHNAHLRERIRQQCAFEATFRETERTLQSAQRLTQYYADFDKRRAASDLLALLAENHAIPTSAIYRRDRRTGDFKCVAVHGMPDGGFSSFSFPAGVLTKAAESGRIIRLACIDRSLSNPADSISADAKAPLVETLVVPTMYRESCLSIVVVAGVRRFTAAELAFIDSLRDQLGVAQHNLQLYADSKRLANELHVRNIEIAEKNLQLQDISRTKSEFVANMSHELRTPLNAILGFTGTLLMQLPGPLNADQEKQLGTIQSSARHLLSLINDLLDVEKIESGKFQVQLEEVVLQSLIHEVFETLQPLAAQKKLGFKLSLPKADIRVLTDRRAVHQMLINLLNNAIKFTEHGQVSLQVSRRRTGASGTVELLVADTGIGIKPELQGQLFQAFTQLDGTSTRNFHGTGLGLYLSRRLATLVGGNLHCESQYGKGSVFTLALPVQRT